MGKRKLAVSRKKTPYSTKGLGIFQDNGKTFLFHAHPSSKKYFQIDESKDGMDFRLLSNKVQIKTQNKGYENSNHCQDFRTIKVEDEYYLTYKVVKEKHSSLCGAKSKDLVNWQKIGNISTPGETGTLVPDFKYKDQYVLYFGEEKILVATSSDLKSWKTLGGPINFINKKDGLIKIMDAEVTEGGIMLFYFQYEKNWDIVERYCLKAALFEKDNPNKLLWDLDIWQQKGEVTKERAKPIGVTLHDNKLISYWQYQEEKIIALVFPKLKAILKKTKPSFISPVIKKYKKNPILGPIKDHYWESQATFNPTAFFDEGEVHLVYRAVGDNNISSLGYAKSKDGLKIDKRYRHPVYVPTQPFEGGCDNYCIHGSTKHLAKQYVNSAFVSGPGYGGCEDPRITKIDGRYHMIYVAFDGWREPRLAITSITCEDFHNEHWEWEKPVLISKPGQINKSGSILPEKINGKYVIFHRVFPNILIDFVDSLDFDGTTYLKGEYSISPRSGYWDSRKVGVGPSPLKTEDGWLVIYNGVDDKDDRRYQIGAMLLDANDPTKIKYRAPASILEPTEGYENEGLKYGVVYPCGAVIKDDTLFVYYGASDMTTAVATTNIHKFLTDLKESHSATLVHTETETAEPVLH